MSRAVTRGLVVTGLAMLGAALGAALVRGGKAPPDTNERGDDVPTNDEIFGTYSAYSMPTHLKYAPRDYKPGEIKPVVTVHVTDVNGGFGVAKYQMAPWKVALSSGTVPDALYEQLPDPSNIEESARILALMERLHGNAYHAIGSRVLGDLRNYPITLRTSHGDAGNIGPGWALDSGDTEPMTEALVDAGRRSLENLIREVAAATGKQVAVVPHRAWDWPGRANDPGKIVWQAIVLPAIAATGAVAGYNTAAGGRPIPISWDPNAKFSDSGKPLPGVSVS